LFFLVLFCLYFFGEIKTTFDFIQYSKWKQSCPNYPTPDYTGQVRVPFSGLKTVSFSILSDNLPERKKKGNSDYRQSGY